MALGTESDPYVISTIEELREKAIIAGAFLILNNNLACGDTDWVTLTGNSRNKPTIDFDGHKISNPYIVSENGLIENAILKNGSIENVHENSFNANRVGCSFVLKNCSLDNMAVTGDLDAFSGGGNAIITSVTAMDNCNIFFNFENVKNRNAYLINGNASCNITCSRLKLTSTSAVNAILHAHLTGFINPTDCRFEGNAKQLIICDDWSDKELITNCVIALNSGDTMARDIANFIINRITVSNTVYDSGTITFNAVGGLKAVSSADIRNPTKLNSADIGFAVTEVV